MKLEKTKNYSLFTKNHEQRPLDQAHIRRLAESISIFGFLPSKPVQCYKKGQKLIVVDGHHRLAAATAAGAEVYYIIESDRCQQTMAPENVLVKKWQVMDFVRLYAARGSDDYRMLLYYHERGIPVSMAASMMIKNGAGSGNATRAISDGTFRVKDTNQIEKVDALIQEFGNIAPATKSRSFIAAISKCILWEEFDFDMFVRRMRENHLLLEKTSNEEQMLTQIEAIYNFRSRQRFPLKFHVEEAAKARNMKNLKSVKP
jgi:hypothetical protein